MMLYSTTCIFRVIYFCKILMLLLVGVAEEIFFIKILKILLFRKRDL